MPVPASASASAPASASASAPVPAAAANAAAFSLIELLVVMAVSAILMLIAYPSYRDHVLKTRRAEGRAALMAVMLEQERRFTASNAYQSFSATDDHGFQWHSAASPAASAYEISAAACTGETIADCVLLTASPGTARVNGSHRDPVCGRLTLDSTGLQGASGAGPGCW